MEFRKNPNINDEVILSIDDAINLIECKIIAVKDANKVEDYDYSEILENLFKTLNFLNNIN